jgi:hypothetical protein
MHRMHELAQLVEESGAVMIAAHPYRRQLPFELRHEGDWSDALVRAAANPSYERMNAIETHNGRGSERENQFSRELRDRLTLPALAGSDSHAFKDVGRCATQFNRPITGLGDLIVGLKAKRFAPIVLQQPG